MHNCSGRAPEHSGHRDRLVAPIVTADDAYPFGAVTLPIYQTSLFTFANYEEFCSCIAGDSDHHFYSRGDNPTVADFERRVARLEGAERARAFSSGMAAASASVLGLVRAGERIVCVRHVYPDTFRMLMVLMPRLGITVDFVDGGDTQAVADALPGARLLYLESPTSWTFETQDLTAIAAAAKAHGVLTMADNSWATPVFQRPLDHGVDLVIHSASKYLGGHSDTVAGVVAGPATLIDTINTNAYPFLGAKLSPFEAWLLVRGMRTLHLRMRQHDRSATMLTQRLADHAGVTRVYAARPGAEAGGGALTGSSGLFSIALAEGADVARFCDGLELFRIGVSWGGYESLVVPAAACLGQRQPNSLEHFGISPRIVRLHVGLENPEDLWADLERALAGALTGS